MDGRCLAEVVATAPAAAGRRGGVGAESRRPPRSGPPPADGRSACPTDGAPPPACCGMRRPGGKVRSPTRPPGTHAPPGGLRRLTRRRRGAAFVRAFAPARERLVAREEARRRRRGRARRWRARAAAAAAPPGPARDAAALARDAARRELAQHLGHRRHAAVDLDPQVLAEAAARGGQVPHLRTFSRRPPVKRSGCTLPWTMTSSSSFSSSRLALSSSSLATASIGLAAVVELEDRHAAALAVDDAQVADDAGQQLRLAAVDAGRRSQRCEAAAPRRRSGRTDGPTG